MLPAAAEPHPSKSSWHASQRHRSADSFSSGIAQNTLAAEPQRGQGTAGACLASAAPLTCAPGSSAAHRASARASRAAGRDTGASHRPPAPRAVPPRPSKVPIVLRLSLPRFSLAARSAGHVVWCSWIWKRL